MFTGRYRFNGYGLPGSNSGFLPIRAVPFSYVESVIDHTHELY